MVVSANNPFTCYLGKDGQPIDGGFVNFGVANQDPLTVPVAVFWDPALTEAATQPIRTIGGFADNGGFAGNIYTAGDFSIRTADRNNVQQFTAPSNTFRPGSVGGITLANGDILLAQAGSDITMEDGSNLFIGDGGGTGVTVTTAPNARWTGGLIPIVTGEPLGSATRRWDAFLDDVDAGDVIADTMGVSGALYSTASTSPTNNREAIALNQLSAVLANGRITYTAGVPALSNTKNCASIADIGVGIAEITLTVAVDDGAQVFVCPRQGSAGHYFGIVQAASNGLIIEVRMFDGAAAAADRNVNFLVVGAPRTLVPAV